MRQGNGGRGGGGNVLFSMSFGEVLALSSAYAVAHYAPVNSGERDRTLQ